MDIEIQKCVCYNCSRKAMIIFDGQQNKASSCTHIQLEASSFLLYCDAIENEDFESFSQKNEKGGRPKTEYIIKLNTAKEMAMLERNQKGKEVRRYFIQVEKKYKEQASRPLSAVDMLRLQSTAILELDGKINAVDKDLKELKRNQRDMAVSLIHNYKTPATLAGQIKYYNSQMNLHM